MTKTQGFKLPSGEVLQARCVNEKGVNYLITRKSDNSESFTLYKVVDAITIEKVSKSKNPFDFDKTIFTKK